MSAAPNTQRYKVSITFEYESLVFDGDPDDVFQLASLERDELNGDVEGALASLTGYDPEKITFHLEPVL